VGSPAIYKDLLFVPTGNGVDADHPGAVKVRALEAPSLVCLNKRTGKVVWKDNSPGKEGYGGNHASPLIVDIAGKVQVIHPQADGWVRSFEALTGKLVWKFDSNRKEAKWDWLDNQGTARHVVVATPVYAEKYVYFGAGREAEFSLLPGRLFCVDPTKVGDISSELEDGKGKGKPNPNSGLVWDYTKVGDKPTEVMFQTTSSVAVYSGLVIALDRAGSVHCLDAKTGKRYWTHDTRSAQLGDPLVADGKVYVANEGGIVTILELSKVPKVVAKHECDSIMLAPPVFANGTLYVLAHNRLFAIGGKK